MFKKNLVRNSALVLLAVALVLFSGCISSNENVGAARAGLRAGDDDLALQWAEGIKQSVYSKQLGYLETGRVRMLSGDFVGSSTNFAVAIDTLIDQTDEGPVIKVGDVGANIMAGSLTDDRTRPYNLPAYEFIQALNYQMLNYIFLGDITAAGVEARRAVYAQDAIAEKYAHEVDKKNRKAEEQAVDDGSAATAADKDASIAQVDQAMSGMAPVLEKSRSSYENALAWYLCGALLEEQGDLSNAALSYRKANELTPCNPYIRRDFLRMLATQDQIAFKALMRQYKLQPADIARSSAEVIIVFEESFVPQRKSIKIPLPVGGTLTSAEIPIYEAGSHNPMCFEVSCDDTVLGGGSEAVNVQALAYHDLKEKMPGVVLRNVTRIGTRIAAQQVANNAGNDMVKVGVLAFNSVSTLVNKADTRSWCTLPAISYLTCHPVAAGARSLKIHNPATGYAVDIPVEIDAGERRIVWIADIEGCSRIGTASLNGKGLPPTFMIDGSLLTGP